MVQQVFGMRKQPQPCIWSLALPLKKLLMLQGPIKVDTMIVAGGICTERYLI